MMFTWEIFRFSRLSQNEVQFSEFSVFLKHIKGKNPPFYQKTDNV